MFTRIFNSIINYLREFEITEGRVGRLGFFLSCIPFLFFTAVAPSEIQVVTSLFWFMLIVIIAVKRCHDINKSGWWVVLFPLSFLWLLFAPSDGDNQYGPA